MLREDLTDRLAVAELLYYINTLNLTALLSGCYNGLVKSYTCNLTLLLCSHNGDYYGMGNKKGIQNFGVHHMNVVSTSCKISTVLLITMMCRDQKFFCLSLLAQYSNSTSLY